MPNNLARQADYLPSDPTLFHVAKERGCSMATDPEVPRTKGSEIDDELAATVREFEAFVSRSDYVGAEKYFIEHLGEIWFGMETPKFYAHLASLVHNNPDTHPFLRAALSVLNTINDGNLESPESAAIHGNGVDQSFFLTILRIGKYRISGRPIEALAESEKLQQYFGKALPLMNTRGGGRLQVHVQIGISAMLAGDFTRALSAFTQAQIHAPVSAFSFLTRDASTKAALVEASVGDLETAKVLLERADRIPRTSSWAENHIDAHRELTLMLITPSGSAEASRARVALDLHDIGELWPFFILAKQRTFEADGYYSELERTMEAYDSMDLIRVDGQGFSGSIIPHVRASLASRAGRAVEAQDQLARADHRVPYTRLIEAEVDLYSGRPSKAMNTANALKDDARGLRLFDLKRLAVLASAQIQLDDIKGAVSTLTYVSEVPRGISESEAGLFSRDALALANKNVAGWPKDFANQTEQARALPNAGGELTPREIEVLTELASGHDRATIAKKLYISLNTVKTQLRSIYRKLGVTSAAAAVLEAQRRGSI